MLTICFLLEIMLTNGKGTEAQVTELKLKLQLFSLFQITSCFLDAYASSFHSLTHSSQHIPVFSDHTCIFKNHVMRQTQLYFNCHYPPVSGHITSLPEFSILNWQFTSPICIFKTHHVPFQVFSSPLHVFSGTLSVFSGPLPVIPGPLHVFLGPIPVFQVN